MKTLCGGLAVGLALTWVAPARAQETLTVPYSADAKPTGDCADQPKVKLNGTLKWSPSDSLLVIESPGGELWGTVNPDGSAKLRGTGGEWDIGNLFGSTGVNGFASFDNCLYLATLFLDRVIPSPTEKNAATQEPKEGVQTEAQSESRSGGFPFWPVVAVASAVTLLATIVYKGSKPDSTAPGDHPDEPGAEEPQQAD